MEWIYDEKVLEACQRDGFNPSQMNLKKEVRTTVESPAYEREKRILMRLQKKLLDKRNERHQLCG